MKNKRTRCRYTERSVLNIIRYNQEKVDEAKLNEFILTKADNMMSQFLGGSISTLLAPSLSGSFYGQLLCPTEVQNTFPLSRKAYR